MRKIHVFSKPFCDDIIEKLNENVRFILQYEDDSIDNNENLKVIQHQPTDADGWYPDNNSEYMLAIMDVLKSNIGNIEETVTVIQRLDTKKKSKPHKDSYDFTTVLLLNENFKGGDLIIENEKSNLKIGELVVFDSHEMHYVDKLTEGERYTLITFVNIKKKKEKSLI